MKTVKRILLTAFPGIVAVCFAQQPVDSIMLYRRPAHELFDRIEAQKPSAASTGEPVDSVEAQNRYRIFYTAPAIDSLPVTVRGTDPFDLLQQAFRQTDYRVSRFRNDFFIMENRTLATTLFYTALPPPTPSAADTVQELRSDETPDAETMDKVQVLDEVVVTASQRDNIRTVALGVERLHMKDVKNIPTVFGEADVLRIVMSLPGVKSVGEVSSGYNVRGGATDQNLILFNDATIYNPTHLFGVFSAFNPDVVKDMELYKSSIPANYGGRISSVLDIRGREGNRKKLRGSAGIGLLTGRLTL